MSSPRKYASPYLTSVPGLPSAPIKMKKRSKTSISKSNEVDAEGEEAKSSPNNEAGDSQPPAKAVEQETKFDAASGDMDQTAINDIISSTKSISISSTQEAKVQETGTGEGEGSNIQESVTSAAKVVVEKPENLSQKQSKTDEKEKSLQAKLPDEKNDQSASSALLKSILKKPSLYRVKPKTRDIINDTNKKSAKTSKGRTGKFSKDSIFRSQGKQKNGATTASASSSKADVKSQAMGNLNSKSPRRKGRPSQEKVEEKAEPLFSPKKSVRFSTRVDVHPVPYESRAGTRACDWQRNMLEQRVQTFRQLMKDVGTDEIDLFGSGMLFPGYSYHLPNPNFALRGARIRNFKL